MSRGSLMTTVWQLVCLDGYRCFVGWPLTYSLYRWFWCFCCFFMGWALAMVLIGWGLTFIWCVMGSIVSVGPALLAVGELSSLSWRFSLKILSPVLLYSQVNSSVFRKTFSVYEAFLLWCYWSFFCRLRFSYSRSPSIENRFFSRSGLSLSCTLLLESLSEISNFTSDSECVRLLVCIELLTLRVYQN
jgi:hypothetical protein